MLPAVVLLLATPCYSMDVKNFSSYRSIKCECSMCVYLYDTMAVFLVPIQAAIFWVQTLDTIIYSLHFHSQLANVSNAITFINIFNFIRTLYTIYKCVYVYVCVLGQQFVSPFFPHSGYKFGLGHGFFFFFLAWRVSVCYYWWCFCCCCRCRCSNITFIPFSDIYFSKFFFLCCYSLALWYVCIRVCFCLE